jgi:hypothetical protein
LACGTGSAQGRKDKYGTVIPDIQLMQIQYLDRALPDPPGELQSIMTRTVVRNNTSDRVITGILWKVQIRDAKTTKVVEVLHLYTYQGFYNLAERMKIPPRATMDVAFWVSRKVHVERRETTVEVENYTYTNYDKDRDKPQKADLYSSDPWPYKGRTDPVAVEPKK